MANLIRESSQILRYWRNTLADHDRRSVDRKTKSAAVTLADIKVGALPRALTLDLFKAWEQVLIEKTKRRALLDADPDLAPLIIGLVTVEASKSKAKREHTLVWVPALLDRDSYLRPYRDRPPWLTRDVLEPTQSNAPVLSTVDEYDDFLRANRRELTDWAAVMEYTERLVRELARQPLEGFELFGYDVQAPFVQLYTDESHTALHLLDLYDALLHDKEHIRPNALPALWRDTEEPARAPVIQESRHVGQMEGRYALSTSQREALHAVIAQAPGEIIAINGPPGTGKTTTLTESIIATSVVERALARTRPAVLVATSTNNQAITNIQDVLAQVEVPSDHALFGNVLVERWLPDVPSYALYFPAGTRKIDVERHPSYARIKDRRWEGLVATMEDPAYVARARAYYVERAYTYGCRSRTVAEHVNALHDELTRAKAQFDKLLGAHARILAARSVVGPQALAEREKRLGEVDTFIASTAARLSAIESECARLQSRTVRLGVVAAQFREKIQPTSMLEKLFPFLKSVKESQFARLRAHAAAQKVAIPPAFHVRVPDRTQIEHWLTTAFSARAERTQLAALEKERMQLRKHNERAVAAKSEVAVAYRELEAAQDAWRSQTAKFYSLVHPGAPANSSAYDDPQVMIADVDVAWRVYMFHLAARYWEGCWLLEMERLQHDETGLRGNAFAQTEARYQRFCMVTPLLVTTFYMLPRYFSCWAQSRAKPMIGSIDLLIVDEAGQATPEVGAPAFALARAALVVGDVDQIEPIPNTYAVLDEVALEQAGLHAELLASRGARAIDGSVMALGRSVSAFVSPDSKGLQLVDHRRSFDRIVAFSNDLVYRNAVRPLRGQPAPGTYPLPQLAYAHVAGTSSRMGGSVRNSAEAILIAEWLARNKQKLENHYAKLGPKRALSQLVAVITPFRAQVMEIARALDDAALSDIEVGTVNAFQGAERPIVIFSSVYTQKDAPFRFINAKPNFLNSAVSRAQDSFVAFGDVHIYQEPGHIAVLGKHLFAESGNCITDVQPLNRFSNGSVVLKTLMEHRNLFQEAVQHAKTRLILSCPFVRLRPGAQGAMAGLAEAAKRGVHVVLVTDRASITRSDRVAHQALRNTGVDLRVTQAIHGSTLSYDDVMISEGGFNWLDVDADVNPTRSNTTTAVCRGPESVKFISDLWRTADVLAEDRKSA